MTLPRIPPMLVEALRRGSCVLFVGAGLSQGAGLPGWKELLSRILSWYEQNSISVPNLTDIQKLLEEKDLLPAAEAIKDAVHLEMFRRALSSIIDDEGISPSPTHLLLPTIPFAAVLTSNYDRLLEKTYGKVAQLPWVITHNNVTALTAALHEEKFYILKVHGTIEHIETIILGRRSYRELMHGNDAYNEHVRTLLRTKTVIFVGFSLSDPDLRLIMDQEQVIWKGHNNIHYALMNGKELNPILQREWERDYGIQILPYEPSNDYHPEVGEFLKELARQVSAPEGSKLQQSSEPETGGVEQSSEDLSLPRSKPETETPASRKQIDDAVGALTEALGSDDFAGQGRLPKEVDDFQLLRVQLLTATWLVKDVPSSALGTHESNRLYVYREQLKPTSPEYVELLRMLVNESLDYIPGWYWFRKFEAAGIESVILNLALTDAHSLVRQGAFNLLAGAKIPLQSGYEEHLLRAVTLDGSTEVRRAAVSYLGSVGGESYLPVIGSALVDKEARVRSEAKQSKLLVLARTEPDRAFAELLSDSGVEARGVLNELLPRVAEVQPETLKKAREHADRDIKLFAVKELIKRAELTIEDASSLKQDKDSSVKATAYQFLIERGAEFEPNDLVLDVPDDSFGNQMSRRIIVNPSPPVNKEEILLTFFKRYDFDHLLEFIDWNNIAISAAYRTLAMEHFPKFADRLRADLSDSFAEAAKSYYEQKLAYWRESFDRETNDSRRGDAWTQGPDLLGGLLSQAFKPSRPETPKPTAESMARSDVEYIKTDLVTAALAGLVKHGKESDAEFARPYLYHDDYDLRLEAVRLVSRFGVPSDAPDLIKIAKSTDGVLRELAARGAIQVSKFDSEVIKTLIETRDEVLVSVGVHELIGYEDKGALSALLEPFLYDESDEVRAKVMVFFISRYTPEELEELLNRYLSVRDHYYPVVCGLDEVLYAPARLAEYFKSKALEELQRSTWTC